MKYTRRLLPLLTAVVLLGGTASAFAATPQLSPATIFAEGFETASSSRLTIAPINIAPAVSTGWWGRTNRLKHAGSWSLWCNGSTAPATWPAKYANGSAGTATFDAAELQDYYAAKLSFSYSQPNLGGADQNSLTAHWYDAAQNPWTGIFRYGVQWFPLTAENGWRSPQYWLMPPYSATSLSRRPGKLVFQWMDAEEASGETPLNAEGPSLDDVTLSGWYFGPVRNLTAGLSGNNVTVSWLKPVTSVGSTTADPRTMTFRVWRAPLTAPDTWTERTTGSGVGGTSFTDSAVPTGSYRYLVQAYDASGHYGMVRIPNETVSIKVGAPAPMVERVQGASRIQTAIEASKRAYPRGLDANGWVVIADGWDWQSSLPGAALAGALHGPLLLANYTSADLPQDVADELIRLGAKQAYVVGSNAHVQERVLTQLGQLGISSTRIDGGSASATARDVAARMKALRGNTTGGTVFLARDDDFADALSASGLAAKMAAPISLTNSMTLSPAADQMLASLKPATIVICGSPLAVTTPVENTVKTKSSAWGATVLRKAGASRVDTGRVLNEYGRSTLNASPKRAFLAYGWNYPDALGGGVLTAIDGGAWNPLLLIHQNSLDTTVAQFIDQTPSIHDGSIFGSPLAVGSAVDSQLLSHLHP